jgi:hypothetical protein
MQRLPIRLIYRKFGAAGHSIGNVDAHAYAGEFPAFRAKCTKEVAAALPQDRSDRARVDSKLELAAAGIGDVDPRRKGARQASAGR